MLRRGQHVWLEPTKLARVCDGIATQYSWKYPFICTVLRAIPRRIFFSHAQVIELFISLQVLELDRRRDCSGDCCRRSFRVLSLPNARYGEDVPFLLMRPLACEAIYEPHAK